MAKYLSLLMLSILCLPVYAASPSCPAEPAKIIALDAEFQAATAKNDADGIARLLPDDYVLVTGKGKVYSKADLIAEARGGGDHYTRQDDSQQTVRFVGDVAVITALLWVQGTVDGQAIDYKLWFSDVYTCRADGWRYTFAQSSIHVPEGS